MLIDRHCRRYHNHRCHRCHRCHRTYHCHRTYCCLYDCLYDCLIQLFTTHCQVKITAGCNKKTRFIYLQKKQNRDLKTKFRESKFKSLIDDDEEDENLYAWKDSLTTLVSILSCLSKESLLKVDIEMGNRLGSLSHYPDLLIKKSIIELLDKLNADLDEKSLMSVLKLLETNFSDSSTIINKIYKITKKLSNEKKIMTIQRVLRKSLVNYST